MLRIRRSTRATTARLGGDRVAVRSKKSIAQGGRPVHRSKSRPLMSAMGQERTPPAYLAMSTLPLKADKAPTCWHVRSVPCVDGSELARLFFTFAGWSVQPCVRPVSAAHEAAGHNALRGSGPGQKPAFEMHWQKWVFLIAGSAASALRAVRPPNLHITPDVGTIDHAASTTGSL